MTIFDRAMLIFIAFIVLGAKYDASEAHKHVHELGCAMDYDQLCKWHEATP